MESSPEPPASAGPALDRLKLLLDEAAALDGAARASYLDRECGSDVALRARVDRLLRAHEAAGSFLRLDPADPGPEAPSQMGRCIGPYTLLERIGEGGFGAVYLARQDEPIRRQVAIKLVRAGASSAQVLARFDAERQLLALMDHPNITIIHDAGVTPEGDPYFVMEYVAGQPITQYADAMKLRVDERLSLVHQLCEAVQHAHQKGIIHRDLKPSNVLVSSVDGRPVIKVIDFGMAKVMDVVRRDTLLTREGVVLGTPEYMSPEQASASPASIDTRSDVYSLGVMLYELLAGATPFARDEGAETGIVGLLQRIRDEEPPRLTARLAPASRFQLDVSAKRRADPVSLARTLRGDLEWITMKALEKSPARRYGSAAALGEDIDRHLAGLPILARPPSTTYQLRKLVARHRATTALASALVLLLVGFAVAMSFLFAAQRTQRLRAEQASAFLREMIASADPENARGDDVRARDVLDRAAERVSRLDRQPVLQHDLEATLAAAYGGLGLPNEALRHARECAAIAVRLHGRQSPEGASALTGLGAALTRAGQPDSAVIVLREAEATLRRARHARVEKVRSKLALGEALASTGQRAEAERTYREALLFFESPNGQESVDHASTLNALAQVLQEAGKFEEAERLQREALKLHVTLSGGDHPDVLTNMSNLGILLRQQGKYAEAESVYRAAIAVERRVLGGDHPNLATGLSNLGLVLKTVGRREEAESLYVESIRIRRRSLGNEHPDLAGSLNNLGALYVSDGRWTAAEACYREALAIRRKAFGERHLDVATVEINLANLCSSSGRHEEAERLARSAVATREGLLDRAHPELVRSRQALAQILLGMNRAAEARELMTESLAVQGPASNAVSRAWSQSLLGTAIARLGDPASAESLVVGALPEILDDETFAGARKKAALRSAVEVLERLGKRDAARGWQARLDSLSRR